MDNSFYIGDGTPENGGVPCGQYSLEKCGCGPVDAEIAWLTMKQVYVFSADAGFGPCKVRLGPPQQSAKVKRRCAFALTAQS